MQPGVVLVTGVSRYLGGRFARLLANSVPTVIGVDVLPPTHDLGNARFVRADIRNPVIAKVIDREGVDTVVHMSVIATATKAGGRMSMKEINVIGTMQLLAACHKSTTVRQLVVKSTAAVYGGSPRDPARFTEEDPARKLPRSGWGKDSVEVEGYVRGFSRRRPDVRTCVLRFANAVGPGMQTQLTDYFRMPVAPTVLGFDPRLQLVHEDDLIEALRLATIGEASGTINVAGDGVLTLMQALGMTGRPPLPVPRGRLAGVGRALGRVFGADLGSDLMLLLTYGRAVDTTRMRTELGLEPHYTTRSAFADLIAARGIRPLIEPRTLDDVVAGAGTAVGTVDGLVRAVLRGVG